MTADSIRRILNVVWGYVFTRNQLLIHWLRSNIRMRENLHSIYLEEIRKRKYRELLRLKADAVIPVPIHKKKRRKRGFNQAEIFAKGIAEMLDQPMYTKIVERIHDTKPQKQLSPGERKNNLKKAFRGNLKEYQKAGMPKRVLVIDDIYTTGSTAEAVTTALKQLGVQEVYVFCIAIGKGFS